MFWFAFSNVFLNSVSRCFFLLLFLGWLGAVKSIQQPHTACQTLHTIFLEKLHINCNSDEIVYVNQVTLNDLGKESKLTVHNNSECQKTSDPACFRSIPSDIPWNYTFYRKISNICNRNYNCTLENSDLNFYASQFLHQSTCSDKASLYRIRIGCIFECFLCKYFVSEMYKWLFLLMYNNTSMTFIESLDAILFIFRYHISVISNESFIVPVPSVRDFKDAFKKQLKMVLFFHRIKLEQFSKQLTFLLVTIFNDDFIIKKYFIDP